jgi:hypothetical protein
MSVYQIVYCSKNRIAGSSSDIDTAIGSILAGARATNKAADVSGALLFNGMAFAQVLEGSLSAVEQIFEKIQCDERHSNVVVLRNAEAPERIFSDWSMAYADPRAIGELANAEVDLDEAFSHPEASGPRIVSLLRQLVTRDFA